MKDNIKNFINTAALSFADVQTEKPKTKPENNSNHPIIIEDGKPSDKKAFEANGVNLTLYDIATLDANTMMNDTIVTVLLR